MFNLLRRRMRRKNNNKNKYNIDDNVPKYSANQHTSKQHSTTTTATASTEQVHSGEHYRQYVDHNEHYVRGQPTSEIAVGIVGPSITKIENDEGDETEDATAVGLDSCFHINDGKIRNKNETLNAGKIYFENIRDNERQLKIVENVEILPQASKNFDNTSASKLQMYNNDVDSTHYEQVQAYNVEEKEQIIRKRQVDDMSSDLSACGFSHNELLAERQRCVLTTGEKNANLLNRSAIETTTTTSIANIKNKKSYKNIVNTSNNRNVENVSINYSNQSDRAKSSTIYNKTTINNEVKYRNLEKTSRNEAKRQSRLSFTLAGIGIGKKKEVDDRAKNGNLTECLHQETSVNEKHSGHNIKLGPLRKSREYLHNLFMARGRQQNRNQRHHHQQQQHQQQHQSQSQAQVSKLQQIKTIPLPRKNADNAIDNSHNSYVSTSSDNLHETTVSATTTLHLNATNSTNNYRIPLSKNRTNNLQNEAKNENRLLRSNSATHARHHSLSPQLRTKRARSVSFSDTNQIIECDADSWLNNGSDQFSRTVNIAQNGGDLANITAKENFAQGGHNNNNVVNTHGAVSSEKAEKITSAFEHRNHHLKQTSSSEYQANEGSEQSNYTNNNNNKYKLNSIGNKNHTSTLRSTTAPAAIYEMGQTNTKAETPTSEFREANATPSVTTGDRIKKVSFADIQETVSSPINVNLPTITVADYSESMSSTKVTPSEQEVFYDIENSDKINDRVSMMSIDDDEERDANFYIGATPSMSMNDQYKKWQTPNSAFLSQSQMRHNYMKLEDVREEDEHDNEEHNNEEEEDDESEEEEEEEEEEDEEESENEIQPRRPRHLDNELYNSTERSPLKSSDSTLSGSPSDSGIGTESQPATPSNLKSRYSPTTYYPNTTSAQQFKQKIKEQYNFMSFVRDENSTDCDEGLLPCDDIDLDLADDDSPHERLVCIESISLPDVVVESTTATSTSATLSSASSSTTGEHIINISGAAGNSVGNVHFIPIHVEGAGNGTASNGHSKRRSHDDSVIGNGTIEITEDASVMNKIIHDDRHAEKLK